VPGGGVAEIPVDQMAMERELIAPQQRYVEVIVDACFAIEKEFERPASADPPYLSNLNKSRARSSG
jgi:hypothetical protein